MSTFALFFMASLALIITPGPNTFYTTTRSIAQGRRAGVVSALGIGIGSLMHTCAAALGISALLMSSALAYMAIKYLGAAYLIYLGIHTLLQKESVYTSATPSTSLIRILSQGILTSLLNSKTALFFLAFLPQFADPSRGSVAWQIAALGVVFNVMVTLWYTLLALLAGSAGNWLQNRPNFSRCQRWLTGSVLIALGFRVALPERA